LTTYGKSVHKGGGFLGKTLGIVMIIDSLNLNQLRIFELVYQAGSMTQAAKELHLTQ